MVRKNDQLHSPHPFFIMAPQPSSPNPELSRRPGGRGVSKVRWLTQTVLAIGLASLCSDIGHEMATAALPAFLASLGAASAVLGLIEGLADGLSSITKLLSGL